ncbi:MAG: hypothetical protein OEW39_11580 [Deltaproteobacteria bacterium]|nr:hypothetical protein [Deltaproteobacteria bacterium]
MSIENELRDILNPAELGEEAADSEAGADQAPVIEPKPGNMPSGYLEEIKPVCLNAELKYQEVMGVIRTIRKANQVLEKFHAGDGKVTGQDVEAAKQEFTDAKQAYILLGNQINEGIRQIYVAAKTYPEDSMVQDLYITYLAKLLCSLEARNPVENFVRRQADFVFTFDREDVVITEEEQRRGLTKEQKVKELLEQKERQVGRLESRYQKRQLQIRLKAGERPLLIIRSLVRLSKMDPEDIHTMIWIATLMSQELGKIRDPNKRLEMRDDILSYCQRAFMGIDDFLNRQGIQNLSDRDKRRSEYLRTITQIRKPLVEG